MAFKTFVAGAILTAAELNDYLMEQANIVCTSGTRPSSPAEGWEITETDTNLKLIYTGAVWQPMGNYGAWTDFTPTVTQSGNVTVNANCAQYIRLGRLVIAHYAIGVTGTGTAANGIFISLPVNTATLNNDHILGGAFRLLDISAAASAYGLPCYGTTSSFNLRLMSSVAEDAFLGISGFSAALASGDIISGQLIYEANS
jgi:hypothetical protein